MLKIGYVKRYGPDCAAESAADAAALAGLGCDVVRAETDDSDPFTVLHSILDFIGAGDRLVVGRLEYLGASGRAMLSVLERLERRGASLEVIDPHLSSQGPGGSVLRAALEAVAAVEPPPQGRTRGPAAAQDIRALQRAGIGPVEIARRLGVSRMTVWRKLKALETCEA
jgi:DNA invertase Pin-like site-specific DNA recombinase